MAPSGTYSTSSAYVVAQLSPTNQWQWAVGGSGSVESAVLGVAYTTTGTLWGSGYGKNGTVVGPATLVAATSGGRSGTAGFVGQLTATGQWSTVHQLSPTGDGGVVFVRLAVDGAGTAVLLGGLLSYGSPVQTVLDSQPLTATPTTGPLFFVAHLTSAGRLRYVSTVPQPAVTEGLYPADMTLDGAGSLYLAAGLSGGLTLGSSVLTGSNNGNSQGDVVLGKLLNATVLTTRPATAAAALACFPNPARTTATLRLPAPASEPLSVLLADALGREVRRQTLPARATAATLDVAGLAPGLYVVRCGTATGRLVVE